MSVDNGMTESTKVSIVTDGADGLSNLMRRSIRVPTTSVLDWFHIGMRLRRLEAMARRVDAVLAQRQAAAKGLVERSIGEMRHLLWHGKWRQALAALSAATRGTRHRRQEISREDWAHLRRFRDHASSLRTYLASAPAERRHYFRARRQAFRISSAPAESTMAHLVNQRLCKRQSMRWSSEGAHLLLLVRCAILDNRLEDVFRTWYPPVPARGRLHLGLPQLLQPPPAVIRVPSVAFS